jgi:hypothetical protein
MSGDGHGGCGAGTLNCRVFAGMLYEIVSGELADGSRRTQAAVSRNWDKCPSSRLAARLNKDLRLKAQSELADLEMY